jgi:hypothetical protein
MAGKSARPTIPVSPAFLKSGKLRCHMKNRRPERNPKPGRNQLTLKGVVVTGFGHFTRRMTQFPEVFLQATGERLYPGTLNVDVGREIPIKEERRIVGTEIGEPYQDLLFERCLVNGISAWRIRPYVLNARAGFPVGAGGHGDHILEISSATKIPNASAGSLAKITFFRDADTAPPGK